MKKEFSWGDSHPEFIEVVEDEIFGRDCYEKVYPVKEGDVVLDIGASIGPFSWSVMDRASKIIALEPSLDCLPTLEENLKGHSNTFIEKKALGKWDGKITIGKIGSFEGGNHYLPESVPTISFKSLIKKYNLNKIDFIKTDCEGGEYNLFTDENMPFLLNNVRNIVGEFHLSPDDPLEKIEFRYFRDKYLTQFPNYKVYTVADDVDITWSLFKDKPYTSFVNPGDGVWVEQEQPPFMDYYKQVMIHISNDA